MRLSSLQLSCVALVTLALSTAAPPSDAGTSDVVSRSFFDLQCKGTFDSAKFSRLDRICDDCYSFLQDSKVYVLCRDDCFTNPYFPACVEMLQETDKIELFKSFIIKLHGASPVYEEEEASEC